MLLGFPLAVWAGSKALNQAGDRGFALAALAVCATEALYVLGKFAAVWYW